MKIADYNKKNFNILSRFEYFIYRYILPISSVAIFLITALMLYLSGNFFLLIIPSILVVALSFILMPNLLYFRLVIIKDDGIVFNNNKIPWQMVKNIYQSMFRFVVFEFENDTNPQKIFTINHFTKNEFITSGYGGETEYIEFLKEVMIKEKSRVRG